MADFCIKELRNIRISDLVRANSVIIGLDVGDKTLGVSVSDRGIFIATGVTTIVRKGYASDCRNLLTVLAPYNVGLIVFGWPVLMNGTAGSQCEKVLRFITELHEYLPTNYAKWDERFSTKVVESTMIQANLSRAKRKKVIDKGAATYILQGAIDFMNHNCRNNDIC